MERQTSATKSGPQIRAARVAVGLSPEGLAFKAGVSMRTIERIEMGHVAPRRATLKVIADALGLEVEQLGDREAA